MLVTAFVKTSGKPCNCQRIADGGRLRRRREAQLAKLGSEAVGGLGSREVRMGDAEGEHRTIGANAPGEDNLAGGVLVELRDLLLGPEPRDGSGWTYSVSPRAVVSSAYSRAMAHDRSMV